MNIESKIFKKILTNYPTMYNKNYTVGFFPVMQDWFNIQKYNVIHHINRLMYKNYIMISTDAEKACDKNQHPFMTKLSATRIRGELSQLHFKNLPQNLQVKSYSTERTEAFLLRSRTR